MMRRHLIHLATALAVAAGMLMAAPPAPAQAMSRGGQGPGPGMPVDSYSYLASVTREWQQAWELNRRINDPDARSLLTQARSLLTQAGSELTQNHPAKARLLAQSAQSLIMRANQTMRRRAQPGTPQRIEQSLREAEDLVSRLGREGEQGPQAQEVRALIGQSRQAAAEGRNERALRLAELAREQGRRAWQEATRSRMMAQRGAALDAFVGPLVERADQLARASDNDRMRGVAARAQEHLQMARQLDPQSQGAQRGQLLEASMREAELVIRTLDRAGYERHRAERAVAEADAALERAADAVDGESNPDVAQALDQGRDLVRQARERLAADDVVAASGLAEQARRAAQQVIQDALGSLTEESVDQAIAHTDQLLDQAASVTGDEAQMLLRTARERQEEARRLRADGMLRQALARTRIAARLAHRAQELSP